MRLTRLDLDAVDLAPLRSFAASHEFFGSREHYRLLAHLSSIVGPGTAIDIGTHMGDSALALSYSGRPVESFDVEDRIGGRRPPANVHYNIADLFDPTTREQHRQLLLESPLIVIDIDPHEGTRELEMFEWLRANEYGGIVVFDDVWYFKEMRDNFWYRIDPKCRADATMLGHWSGTGIVSFNERIEIEGQGDTSNWTLVTGYFDLTNAPDANDAIRARPAAHYIDQHGQSTLSLEQNLIVFCDPNLEEKIWSMRPEWLHSRTRVVPMGFENFVFRSQHRDRIISNRSGNLGCPSDPRNTASYYLFCMARYDMLKRAIDSNPFDSSHFAWINICIERMGFNNIVHLNEALGQNRDKFSTCWIDYVSREMTEDLKTYFDGASCLGRCSMCSGFFTGDKNSMYRVCDLLQNAFLETMLAGYGHADEQLYPMVYFKNPELFDWYVGDYTEMITNYAGVYEHAERPINNLIRNSFAAGDNEVCLRACEIVLRSYAGGKCHLGFDDYTRVLDFARRASANIK